MMGAQPKTAGQYYLDAENEGPASRGEIYKKEEKMHPGVTLFLLFMHMKNHDCSMHLIYLIGKAEQQLSITQ